MATKRKVIALTKDSFKGLQEEVGASRTTVYQSLNGSCNSETAQKIRHLALTKYNGKTHSKIVW